MSHIYWVVRRTGTPKDKDEINKRVVKFPNVMGEQTIQTGWVNYQYLTLNVKPNLQEKY